MGWKRASLKTGRLASNGKAAAYRRWRTVHLVTGFAVCLWLLVMAATGVLINHQEGFALTEIEVDNDHLPAHYTDEYHPETTRLNVVVADLHSGRFFGEAGRFVSDAVAILIVLSIGSAAYTFYLRRQQAARAFHVDVPAAAGPRADPPREGSRPRVAVPIRQTRRRA